MNLPWIAEILPFKAPTRVPLGTTASPKPQPPLSDNRVDDWKDLLRAVKARLQRCVAEPAAQAVKVRADVLDCVAALDCLQAALLHEGRRRQQLEHDLFQAHTALTQTRAQLRATQAGEGLDRDLATDDPMTTPLDRSCFRERLDRALSLEGSQRQTVALMIIDLDGFKSINYRHGHYVGDEVLRIVALRLLNAVRTKDSISGLGADKFACLVADCQDRKQLSRLACKVFDAVAAPMTVGGIRVRVMPSIGIAMYPTHGLDTEQMMRSADAAMNRAKRSRSGYAFYEGQTGS